MFYKIACTFALLTWSRCFLFAAPVYDTTSAAQPKLPTHWKLTARLHSKGMFMYGGRLGTDDPTFDMNFTIEHKNWGILLLKGVDLQDHHTDYNFALMSVYKIIKVTNKITFTPHIGASLEQCNHFADEGSDIICILTTTVKVNKHLSAEHTALFGSLVFEPANKDWVNRFRATYTAKHLDVVASVWHNNTVFDRDTYLNTGMLISYARIKLVKEMLCNIGITGLTTVYTSDKELIPPTNRLMLTLTLQWVH